MKKPLNIIHSRLGPLPSPNYIWGKIRTGGNRKKFGWTRYIFLLNMFKGHKKSILTVLQMFSLPLIQNLVVKSHCCNITLFKVAASCQVLLFRCLNIGLSFFLLRLLSTNTLSYFRPFMGHLKRGVFWRWDWSKLVKQIISRFSEFTLCSVCEKGQSRSSPFSLLIVP